MEACKVYKPAQHVVSYFLLLINLNDLLFIFTIYLHNYIYYLSLFQFITVVVGNCWKILKEYPLFFKISKQKFEKFAQLNSRTIFRQNFCQKSKCDMKTVTLLPSQHFLKFSSTRQRIFLSFWKRYQTPPLAALTPFRKYKFTLSL